MNSLRNQLLAWLLPSFIALYALAATSLYQVEKTRLYEKLDDQLGLITNQVRSALTRPSLESREKRFSSENLAAILEEIAQEQTTDVLYYQVTSQSSAVLLKSDSMGEVNFALQPGPNIYSQLLKADTKLYIRNVPIPERRMRHRMIITVALDDALLTAKLQSYKQWLVLGGVGLSGLFALILVLVIRKTLNPVASLAIHATNINADNLALRFESEQIPTEIQPFINKLNDLMQRLDDSFVRERQFSNDLAHEMRTPLAAIRATADVAQKWPSDNVNDDFADIEKLSIQMQNMVDTLLTLARLDSDARQLQIDSVVFSSMLAQIIKLHQQKIGEKQLLIQQNFEDEDLTLSCDQNLLHILWANLISNAIAYAPAQSEIEITATTKIMSISNNCNGLTQDDLNKMFERFWRHEQARSQQQHVGLGLSIAKRSAELLGYKLTVELSEQQSGQQKIIFKVFCKEL
ncbi:sensor histidine kinase [Catenovulum agarivorans]|uniref:sensor histidine kinase n=1 Tax=Catenovulum agarivorans TaxID=1172192 RepID=UPI0002F8AAA0|nr:ATP-binding protein [Catenovulum agarivorans]